MIRSVGSYQLLEQLGEGGMGAVYRAIDTQLDREVALKALRPELARRPDIVARFREEARIQGRLESAHIVRLYQFLREGDEYFMVMEFVRGATLSRMLSERKRLTIDSAISIMVQALDGLDYAHGRNIVHRDIKPANIIISQEGVVKVTDFGIARLLGSARMTREGSLIGTLEYISPEAAQGKDATALSDIYSSGVVLYELLTGRLPFSSQNDYELVRMQIQSSPPALRGWVPDISRALESAVLRALAKKPQDRYGNAAEMSRALSECVQMPAAGSAGPESFWSKLRSLASPAASGATPRPVFGNLSPLPLPQDTSDLERERRSAISSLSRRVDELLGQGNWEQAQSEVNRSSAQFPGDPAVLELHNRVVREQRTHAEGLALALNEGRSLLERGLPELARTAVESSLRRYPNSVELGDLLRQVEEQLSALAAGSSQVKVITRQVEELKQQERFQEAINLIIEAVAQLPNRPELTALLSGTVQAQKEREKARAVEACRERVSSLRQSANWTAAMEAIDSLLAQYPGELPLLQLRAEVESERQVRLRAAEVESSIHRARELESNGQIEAAEGVLQEALRRFPDEGALARALTGVRAVREAGRRSVIAGAAIERARELQAEHQWDTALDVLNAALRDAPGEERLERQRAEAVQVRVKSMLREADDLVTRQRIDQASWLLESAARLDPGNPAVRDRLAGIATAGRRDRIQQILQKASEQHTAGDYAGAMALLESLPPAEAAASEVLALRNRIDRDGSESARQLRARELAAAVAAAQLLIGQGNLRSAQSSLEDLHAKYPEEPKVRELLEDVKKCIGAADSLRAVAAIRAEAAALIRAGRTSDARAALQRGLLSYPREAELMRLLEGTAPPEPSQIPETREEPASRPPQPEGPGPAVSVLKPTPRRLWYIGAAAAIVTLILCAGVAILLRHPAATHPALKAADVTPVQPLLNPDGEQAALPPSQPEPVIDRFTADSQRIEPGQGVWLRWSVSNASGVTIEPGIGKVEPSGARFVHPAVATTYSLLARGAGKPSEQHVTVEMTGTQAQPKPLINNFYAYPTTVERGQTATLHWQVSNATSVTIDPGIGEVRPEGSRLVFPTDAQTYVLSSSGPGGTNTQILMVDVTAPQAVTHPAVSVPQARSEPIIHDFTAVPSHLNSNGGTAMLSWYVDNATEVTIEPGIGTVEDVGHWDVVLRATTTYTLLATGHGYTHKREVTIEVTPPADLAAVMAQARDKYASRDFTAAATLFRQAAEGGNAEAMLSLGYLLDGGLGVHADASEAMVWYRKAADAGNVAAMLGLGRLGAKAHDWASAHKWWAKAADAGNGVAMGNLGFLYEQGLGVTADRDEAIAWYKRAVQAGHVGSQSDLNRVEANQADQSSPTLTKRTATKATKVTKATKRVLPEPGSWPGSFQGTVWGPDGKPVAGATVRIEQQGTTNRWDVVTDSAGHYSQGELPSGIYWFWAWLWQPGKVSHGKALKILALSPGQTVTVDFKAK